MFFSFIFDKLRILLAPAEDKTLITMAEQVVLALDQTAKASGPEKKRLALQMLSELARSRGLDPPQLLLDTVIEAAVRLTQKAP